jgi:hypothetical protein
MRAFSFSNSSDYCFSTTTVIIGEIGFRNVRTIETSRARG